MSEKEKAISKEITEFNLYLLMEEVIEKYARESLYKRLVVSNIIDLKVPQKVNGNEALVRKVIEGFLSHAIRFTVQGSVLVRTKMMESKSDTLQIRFEFIDTGIGFSSKKTAQLFEASVKSESSQDDGDIIDLPLCKRMVESMKGKVGVESAPGKGSVFWCEMLFHWPLKNEPVFDWANLTGEKVLVISPNMTIQKVIGEQCEKVGMAVEMVGDRVAGLSHLRQAADQKDPFGIVIVDDQLSGIKDPDFVSSLQIDPMISSTLVVSLVSLGHKKAKKNVVYQEVLRKPVRQTELYLTMSKLMNDRGPQSVMVETPAGILRARRQAHAKNVPNENIEITPLKILIAEDNAVSQAMVKGMLEELGSSVESAFNGKEALEAVKKSDYDLIFMDCYMPEMDGFEATSEIRKLKATEKYIPIVALTADNYPETEEKCRTVGMDDFLAKPVNLEALEKVIRRWMTETVRSSMGE